MCPPPLTVFTDMPADYKLGERNRLLSSPLFANMKKKKAQVLRAQKKACTHIRVANYALTSFTPSLPQSDGRFHMSHCECPQFSSSPVAVALCCVAAIMEVITFAPCLFYSAAVAAQAGCGTAMPTAESRGLDAHTHTHTKGIFGLGLHHIVQACRQVE